MSFLLRESWVFLWESWVCSFAWGGRGFSLEWVVFFSRERVEIIPYLQTVEFLSLFFVCNESWVSFAGDGRVFSREWVVFFLVRELRTFFILRKWSFFLTFKFFCEKKSWVFVFVLNRRASCVPFVLGIVVFFFSSLLCAAGKWRACGWAVVQLDYDEEGPLHGMYGSMEAEYEVQRTIKRAELTA